MTAGCMYYSRLESQLQQITVWFFSCFKEKIKLVISRESSAKQQMIHMKWQTLFSLKNKTKIKVSFGNMVRFIYRIYPEYSDNSTPYHNCTKFWTSTVYYPMLCLKIAGSVANRVDLMRRRVLRRLIWVYTVCSGLSVRIPTVNTVNLSTSLTMRKCVCEL